MPKPFQLIPFITLALSVIAIADERLPVIDMHLHALAADAQSPPPLAMCTPYQMPTWDQTKPWGASFMGVAKNPPCDDPVWSPETDEEVMTRTLAVMERHNVYGVLSGTPERVATWRAAAPGRFFPGLGFIPEDEVGYSVEKLKSMHAEGRLAVLAEIVNQYAGIAPDDERMRPYWQIAEELDIPAGIHMGPGPPGVTYLGSPRYRARLSSPLMLEEVLVRHPRLRIYIMHAGYPMLDDLLALMYAHPQVYVEVGIIVYSQPRPAFYRYLKAITDSGFGKRVMFGSDQMVWPETIERAIAVIEEAPFLDAEQKRDIFYNNAARFLRLSNAEIARHHEMQASR